MWNREFEKIDRTIYCEGGGSITTSRDLGEDVRWELDNLVPGDYQIFILTDEEARALEPALRALDPGPGDGD